MQLTLLFSTAVEASTVALVMTGITSLGMIIRALGSLPWEKQQGKGWSHGSVGRGARAADISGGKTWPLRKRACLSSHEILHGIMCSESGLLKSKLEFKTKMVYFIIIVLMIPFLALKSWALMICVGFCYYNSLSSAFTIIAQHSSQTACVQI